MDSDHSSMTNKSTFLMTLMPHLRSVDKGAFLLLREGVTSLIRANYMVKFYS